MTRSWGLSATVAVALGTMLVIAWVALTSFAIVQAFRFDEKVAEERHENSVRACLERGRTNDGIVGYLRDLGAESDDIQQARVFFPIRTRAICEQLAAETVSKP
jgi:hypothetical protein